MIRLLLALALLLPGAAAAQLRVMSFNVRLPLAGDGANDWPNRRALFVETVRRADPDVIGTQELFRRQGDDVVAALPRYRWFGRDRRGGHADEHMGVFYRADRLTLERSGDFWLSDTPEVPGSISWGHPLPRMVTWGAFRTRRGKRFYLFNTHFPYRAEDEAAREKGAALIARRIAAIAGKAPVVLTGDFNTVPDSATHRTLAASLRDAWDAAPVREGPAETFHGFTGRPERRIDWVFARGLRPTRVRVLTDHDGERYPSDHFPVVVDYRFRGAAPAAGPAKSTRNEAFRASAVNLEATDRMAAATAWMRISGSTWILPDTSSAPRCAASSRPRCSGRS